MVLTNKITIISLRSTNNNIIWYFEDVLKKNFMQVSDQKPIFFKKNQKFPRLYYFLDSFMNFYFEIPNIHSKSNSIKNYVQVVLSPKNIFNEIQMSRQYNLLY